MNRREMEMERHRLVVELSEKADTILALLEELKGGVKADASPEKEKEEKKKPKAKGSK